jgi:putative nucleotidyltransferase with HDIG domain
MRKEFRNSIKEAKKLMRKIKDPAHNLNHSKSVVRTTLKIARHYNVDKDLIELSAWWHDVGRIKSEKHEKLSAQMSSNYLKKLGVEKETCKKVYDSIIFHKWSMKPKTMEGKIIRDADKLDFISIKRWKLCIKNNEIETLKEIYLLLPKLRNEILELDISRKIFDGRIKKFNKFLRLNINNIFQISEPRS